MITVKNINQYREDTISKGDNYLYILPHAFLRPYISHYCISFPTPQTMSDEYTVLPSANSVLGVSVNGRQINSFYNGTNTKPAVVGAYANKNELLLLVKFRAGGFFSFYSFNQNELADFSLDLCCIDKTLAHEIEHGLIKSERIEDLVATLDLIFMSRLKDSDSDYITAVIRRIIARNEDITANELKAEFFYSENHIRRLFLQRIGVPTKKFSRIVRINYALRLLHENSVDFSNVVENAGFFDQSHFIHEFKNIFRLTPSKYIKNMFDFYNTESI